MVMGFVMLCGVRGSLVSNSKEYILLRVFRMVVIVMRWSYSKNFINNVDRGVSKYMLDSRFMYLILVMGGCRFVSLDVVLLVFVCFGLRVVNMGNI